MNSEIKIIVILAVVVIILIIFSVPHSYENFTNDEALQNVASLYNSGMATVTNLRATKDLNVNGNVDVDGSVNIKTNLNATKNITTTDMNVNGILTSNNIKNPGRIHISGDELLYLLNKNGVIIGKEWGGNGNLTVQGNANINGTITEKVNVVYPSEPHVHLMLQYITDKNYFNKNMPDGTLLKFLFIHPGNMNPADPTRYYKYLNAVKAGSQFLIVNVQDHWGIPNPQNNKSNDLSWRGNIN